MFGFFDSKYVQKYWGSKYFFPYAYSIQQTLINGHVTTRFESTPVVLVLMTMPIKFRVFKAKGYFYEFGYVIKQIMF
jgi:hypothetical protein